MTAQLIRADSLHSGVPYAYASVTRRSALVFTAGACPLDANGNVVGPGDVKVQAMQAMENLGEALAAAGAGTADVLKTTVYVASSDRSDLVAAWNVVRAAFADHDAPSTLLGVVALGYEGQLVEIEAVAEIRAAPTDDTDGGWVDTADTDGGWVDTADTDGGWVDTTDTDGGWVDTAKTDGGWVGEPPTDAGWVGGIAGTDSSQASSERAP